MIYLAWEFQGYLQRWGSVVKVSRMHMTFHKSFQTHSGMEGSGQGTTQEAKLEQLEFSPLISCSGNTTGVDSASPTGQVGKLSTNTHQKKKKNGLEMSYYSVTHQEHKRINHPASPVNILWKWAYLRDTKAAPCARRWCEDHPSWLPWVQGSVWSEAPSLPDSLLPRWWGRLCHKSVLLQRGISTHHLVLWPPAEKSSHPRKIDSLRGTITTPRQPGTGSGQQPWLLNPASSRTTARWSHRGAKVHRPSISIRHYGKASTYT